MARRYFAVAYRAIHESSKSAHLSAEVVCSRSKNDVERISLANFESTLTAEGGWSMWRVVVARISDAWIRQVAREALWFDRTGAHRLFAIAVYVTNTALVQSAVLSGSVLAINEGLARDMTREFAAKRCPPEAGWKVLAIDLEEFTDYPSRRRPEVVRWTPKGVTTH
jgi:hypothetical protein